MHMQGKLSLTYPFIPPLDADRPHQQGGVRGHEPQSPGIRRVGQVVPHLEPLDGGVRPRHQARGLRAQGPNSI